MTQKTVTIELRQLVKAEAAFLAIIGIEHPVDQCLKLHSFVTQCLRHIAIIRGYYKKSWDKVASGVKTECEHNVSVNRLLAAPITLKIPIGPEELTAQQIVAYGPHLQALNWMLPGAAALLNTPDLPDSWFKSEN